MDARAHHTRVEPDEHQYERHRGTVLALLRARFGTALTDVDREDLYHEAWAGVLEHRRRGQPTPDLLGLLKTIAWRRGRDRLRNISAEPSDPSDGVVAHAFDSSPAPEEQVLQRLDADLCRELIEALGERQRAIVKLRCEWGLAPAEIQDALGISRKTYEKQLTRALKRLASERHEIEDGRWRNRQLELLKACEAGTATPEERARAARLVQRDPMLRAMLRRLRGAAALVPLPVILYRRLLRRVVRSAGSGAAGRGRAIAVAGTPGAAAGGVAAVKVAAVCAAGLALVGGVTAELQSHVARARAIPPARLRVAEVVRARRRSSTRPLTHRKRTPRPALRARVAVPQNPPQRLSTAPAGMAPARIAPAAARAAPLRVARPRRRATPRGDGSQEFGP